MECYTWQAKLLEIVDEFDDFFDALTRVLAELDAVAHEAKRRQICHALNVGQVVLLPPAISVQTHTNPLMHDMVPFCDEPSVLCFVRIEVNTGGVKISLDRGKHTTG